MVETAGPRSGIAPGSVTASPPHRALRPFGPFRGGPRPCRLATAVDSPPTPHLHRKPSPTWSCSHSGLQLLRVRLSGSGRPWAGLSAGRCHSPAAPGPERPHACALRICVCIGTIADNGFSVRAPSTRSDGCARVPRLQLLPRPEGLASACKRPAGVRGPAASATLWLMIPTPSRPSGSMRVGAGWGTPSWFGGRCYTSRRRRTGHGSWPQECGSAQPARRELW